MPQSNDSSSVSVFLCSLLLCACALSGFSYLCNNIICIIYDMIRTAACTRIWIKTATRHIKFYVWLTTAVAAGGDRRRRWLWQTHENISGRITSLYPFVMGISRIFTMCQIIFATRVTHHIPITGWKIPDRKWNNGIVWGKCRGRDTHTSFMAGNICDSTFFSHPLARTHRHRLHL